MTIIVEIIMAIEAVLVALSFVQNFTNVSVLLANTATGTLSFVVWPKAKLAKTTHPSRPICNFNQAIKEK